MICFGSRFAADLGYWVWFKFFGLWGIVYLFALVIGFYFYALRCGQLGDAAHVGRFATYHFVCILISMLTINYLTDAGRDYHDVSDLGTDRKGGAERGSRKAHRNRRCLISGRVNEAPAPGGR